MNREGPFTKGEKEEFAKLDGPHKAAVVREELVMLKHTVYEVRLQFEIWQMEVERKMEGLRQEFYSLEARLAKR